MGNTLSNKLTTGGPRAYHSYRELRWQRGTQRGQAKEQTCLSLAFPSTVFKTLDRILPFLWPCRQVLPAFWPSLSSGCRQKQWAVCWSKYLKAQPLLWPHKRRAHVHSCVKLPGKIPTFGFACIGQILHCTEGWRMGSKNIPGDSVSCCFGSCPFQKRGKYTCGAPSATELWASGAIIYPCHLGKARAFL